MEASGENVIGRTSEDQITVVDLTGIAIQDIQIAKMVNRSLRKDKKQTDIVRTAQKMSQIQYINF